MLRFGVTGWSGSGKTTLIRRLLPRLRVRGLEVATVKHARHGFDLLPPDHPARAWRAAGAVHVVLAAPEGWAHLREGGGGGEPSLDGLLGALGPVDLVLIEGYKRGGHDKIEVHRGDAGKPLLAARDPTVVAVASDRAIPAARLNGRALPVFDLDNVAGIAAFLLSHCGMAGTTGARGPWHSSVTIASPSAAP